MLLKMLTPENNVSMSHQVCLFTLRLEGEGGSELLLSRMAYQPHFVLFFSVAWLHDRVSGKTGLHL